MSHTHYCAAGCGTVVAVCDGPSDEGYCAHEGPQYCSLHHPDPKFRVEDKPTVRMTVKIAPDEKVEAK